MLALEVCVEVTLYHVACRIRHLGHLQRNLTVQKHRTQ